MTRHREVIETTK